MNKIGKILLHPIINLWLPFIGLLLLIFFFPWPPGLFRQLIKIHFHFDKFVHMILFAVLSLWLFRINYQELKLSFAKSFVLCLFLMIMIALFDEYHQIGKPFRRWEYLDLVFDGVGIVLGLTISSWIRQSRPRTES